MSRFFSVAVFSCLAFTASAQPVRLQGQVLNAAMQPVAGAFIEAKLGDETWFVRTDANGNYVLRSGQIGVAKLMVHKPFVYPSVLPNFNTYTLTLTELAQKRNFTVHGSTWSVRRIGQGLNARFVNAAKINNRGDVVGSLTRQVDGRVRRFPFVYEGARSREIAYGGASLDFQNRALFAINDNGWAVGERFNEMGQTIAWIHTLPGVPAIGPGYDGLSAVRSTGRAISNSGVIAGSLLPEAGIYQGGQWRTVNEGTTPMIGTVTRIANNGSAVGWGSRTLMELPRAIYINNLQAAFLEPMPGDAQQQSSASAISPSANAIVGTVGNTAGLWQLQFGKTTFKALPESIGHQYERYSASGVNDDNKIIGWAGNPNPLGAELWAMLWDGGLVESIFAMPVDYLSTYGIWETIDAHDINNRQQILATVQVFRPLSLLYGTAATITFPVVITPSIANPPVARIGFLPLPPDPDAAQESSFRNVQGRYLLAYTGEDVEFDGSGSFDIDGSIAEASWIVQKANEAGQADDPKLCSSTINQVNLKTICRFEEEGWYLVHLTVIDNDGDIGNEVGWVYVSQKDKTKDN